MKYLYLIFTLLILPFDVAGQTVCTIDSRERVEGTLQKLAEFNLNQKPIHEILVEVGQWYLETPYVAKTIELPDAEKLVIEMKGVDCTTYLESMVTFARLAKLNTCEFEDFEQQLEFLRYRDGVRDGYPSRLHYFSDWIYNNQQKGIIKDITQEIGGIPYENNLNFMSTHPSAYAQLSDKAFVERIEAAEADISQRSYYYLPKETLGRHLGKIRNGDLIAITTGIEGLDMVHVGLAIQYKGSIHLLHASTGTNQVTISEKPLDAYLKGNKSQSGVMVCRLVEPTITKPEN